MEASRGPQPPRKLVAELPVYINPNEEIVTTFGGFIYTFLSEGKHVDSASLSLSLSLSQRPPKKYDAARKKAGNWARGRETKKSTNRARVRELLKSGVRAWRECSRLFAEKTLPEPRAVNYFSS